MSVWTEIKKILNEKKNISKSNLRNEIFTNFVTNVKHITISRYLDILKNAGFIKFEYAYLSKYDSIVVPYCKLIRKIPEELTIMDALRMKRIPWLRWFKYPE